jgi:hypothetical protein
VEFAEKKLNLYNFFFNGTVQLLSLIRVWGFEKVCLHATKKAAP